MLQTIKNICMVALNVLHTYSGWTQSTGGPGSPWQALAGWNLSLESKLYSILAVQASLAAAQVLQF